MKENCQNTLCTDVNYCRTGTYDKNVECQTAAWDVHRGIVVGRCEKKTGIKPFGLLVDQVLEQDPYKDATQLF
jgi:hypothetical protein